jgi:hypothetical protein
MTFKIAKAATSSAALNLKLSKSVASPASSLSADQIAKTDLITGGNFSAAGIQEKVIAGAGIQDIARADQIIGILDRGGQGSFDQFGLHSPSVQNPMNPGGGILDALDPGVYIGAHDRSSGLQGIGRQSRMEGCIDDTTREKLGDGSGAIGSHPAEDANGRQQVSQTTTTEREPAQAGGTGDACKSTTTTTYSDGSSTTTTEEVVVSDWSDGEYTVDASVSKESKSPTGETYKSTSKYQAHFAGGEKTTTRMTIEEKRDANGNLIARAIGENINPNPEDDGAHGDFDISGKPDPLGVLDKLGQPIERLAGFNPTIDPLDESYGHHGTYTGPSLGAVTDSYGGTSTGSWNNPYGVGGYSGPSIDAFVFSHGGTSTGTFDPLF